MYYFPIEIANHIAQALELPGLFLGTYSNTTIDYIHYTNIYSFWHHSHAPPLKHLIIIKSNDWLRGIIIYSDRSVSPLVNLEYDLIFDLLEEHNVFPSDNGIEDSSYLNVALLQRSGVRLHKIYHPVLGHSHSLEIARQKMINYVEERIQIPSTIVAQEKKFDIEEVRFDWSPKNFIRLYQLLSIFGKSGLFDLPHAPHNTEYLLFLHHNNYEYIFLKTNRSFRGVRVPYKERYVNYFDKNFIEQKIRVPNVNWEQLLLNVKNPTRGNISINFVNKDMNIRVNIKIPGYSSKSVELWESIEDLITQFPED